MKRFNILTLALILMIVFFVPCFGGDYYDGELGPAEIAEWTEVKRVHFPDGLAIVLFKNPDIAAKIKDAIVLLCRHGTHVLKFGYWIGGIYYEFRLNPDRMYFEQVAPEGEGV